MATIANVTTSDSPTATGTTSQVGTRLSSQFQTPQLFIKLLMAELEHQDPTNPTTPATILQQVSELAQVEAVTTENQSLQQETHAVSESAATGLIGKQVSASATGKTVTGVVTGITVSKTGTPMLTIATTSVPLSSVTSIAPVTSSATAQSSTPATT